MILISCTGLSNGCCFPLEASGDDKVLINSGSGDLMKECGCHELMRSNDDELLKKENLHEEFTKENDDDDDDDDDRLIPSKPFMFI